MVIVGFILTLAGIAGYFMPAPTEATPSRLLMENPGGRVIFTHKAHSTPGGSYGDWACADCHHELKAAPWKKGEGETPPVMRCTACHGSADNPDFVAQHQKSYAGSGDNRACVSCHHAAIDRWSDKWSHEDHREYTGEDCAACHHTDGTTPSGREMKNIRPQRCANCHTAKPNPMTATVRKDAGHRICASCHSDWLASGAKDCTTCHTVQDTYKLPARAASDTSYPSCAACHKPVPAALDAFHGSCLGCHDKAGSGPGKQAPCAQCHAPL